MNDKETFVAAQMTATAGITGMSETQMMTVLQSSLYPGAKTESIKLVLGYCKASGLDPMQKPVHIVPMSVKTGRKKPNSNYDEYEMRDTVMPGIGLYRTQASRTGEYAGVTEPEFGPTKTLKIGDFSLEYPEFCRITVRRRMQPAGTIAEFTANERWLENYATAARDSQIPNAMWKKRPFAQLAKCAEAQALRKAFPELGAAPTADEMEGKPYDETEHQAIVVEQPRAKQKAEADQVPAKAQGAEPNGAQHPQPDTASAHKSSAAQDPVAVMPGNGDAPTVSTPAAAAGPSKPMAAAQMRIINAKIKNAGLTHDDVVAEFGEVANWQFDDFAKISEWLAGKTE